jgi:hypothetical protein
MEMFVSSSHIYVTVYLPTTQLGPMPWCRQLVAGLSAQMPGFGSGQSMCNFWWTEWHWDKFLSQYFGLSLSLSFHQCSIIIQSFIVTDTV